LCFILRGIEKLGGWEVGKLMAAELMADSNKARRRGGERADEFIAGK
jgi:hypothetical protein